MCSQVIDLSEQAFQVNSVTTVKCYCLTRHTPSMNLFRLLQQEKEERDSSPPGSPYFERRSADRLNRSVGDDSSDSVLLDGGAVLVSCSALSGRM